MKKLSLDLDSLEVVSFTTDGEHEALRGTVYGRESVSCEPDSFFTLDGGPSCYGMCNSMEYDTCHEAGPTVGPSCEYFCLAYTVGCTQPAETETC